LIRGALLALAALFVAASARADDLKVTIVEYGLYTADTKSETRAPDGITDSVIENLCHYATTTTVPRKAGMHFGFRYRVDGLNPGDIVVLTRIVRFPKTVTPPNGAKPLSAISRPEPSEAGKLHYAGYGLDEDWELMTGRWDFYLYQGQRRLAIMSFVVTEGVDGPAPSTQDANCFNLSSLEGVTR
jgi:hypothetical protein